MSSVPVEACVQPDSSIGAGSTHDAAVAKLAAYAVSELSASPAAYAAARTCLLDAVACALESLRHPDCVRVLGPLVPGGTMSGGARVIGTSYELDPVQAAFNLGAMFRWCADARADQPRDCHPADSLGAILAVADWRSRRAVVHAEPPTTVREVLAGVLKAHEIHAVLAAAQGLHAHGADDVLHVRVATAAVATALLGGTQEHARAAISHAYVDGAPLRPRAGSDGAAARERWAAGDAASRGVRHALLAVAGEPPCTLAHPGAVGSAAVCGPPCAFEPPLGSERLQESLRRAAAPTELEVQHRLADAASAHYSPRQAAAIAALCADSAKLDGLAVHDLVSALVKN